MSYFLIIWLEIDAKIWYHYIYILYIDIIISIFYILISLYLYFIPDIGLGVRVFANGPGDLGSIPDRVIPKTQKMVLDASLPNTQHYKVRIKGKVEQSREGVAPSPTHWCSSYRKGSLRVTLDYGRQLYFFFFISILWLSRKMLEWKPWEPLLAEAPRSKWKWPFT